MKPARLLCILLSLLLLSSAALPAFAASSDVLFCSACGTQIPPESIYCYNCGHKVAEPVSAPRTLRR